MRRKAKDGLTRFKTTTNHDWEIPGCWGKQTLKRDILEKKYDSRERGWE
jgi:hypothetical protein